MLGWNFLKDYRNICHLKVWRGGEGGGVGEGEEGGVGEGEGGGGVVLIMIDCILSIFICRCNFIFGGLYYSRQLCTVWDAILKPAIFHW